MLIYLKGNTMVTPFVELAAVLDQFSESKVACISIKISRNTSAIASGGRTSGRKYHSVGHQKLALLPDHQVVLYHKDLVVHTAKLP